MPASNIKKIRAREGFVLTALLNYNDRVLINSIPAEVVDINQEDKTVRFSVRSPKGYAVQTYVTLPFDEKVFYCKDGVYPGQDRIHLLENINRGDE